MFLAWLLDPKGSHGLGGYPFVLLCRSASRSTWGNQSAAWSRMAALARSQAIDVSPNERNPREHILEDGSRPDIMISNVVLEGVPDEGWPPQVIIEQKVGAVIKLDQLYNYRRIVTAGTSNDFLGIILAPRAHFSPRHIDFLKGGNRWTGIDYQQLHDDLLSPCLRHHALPSRTSFLLNEYIQNLRVMKGSSMGVISQETSELALQLWNKHKEAIRLMAEALREVPEAADTAEELAEKGSDSQVSILNLTINGHEIKESSVRDFMTTFITHLKNSGLMAKPEKLELIPYKAGGRRYFIARKDENEGGDKFKNPVKVFDWFVDAKRSYENVLTCCTRFAKDLGCDIGGSIISPE